ncbi:MAG: succinate dehydrogenase, hydrophobic membrane anchor protein [Methylococcales bacterium]|nr:succinate dehydrogenase, hydrophobic membrane anchor protein [Methylococcales bacterium]MDD5753652.1 succinate dehydrogenase, hydrophobic membrane anchor protein [Methylococcales bacterium]
MKSGTHHWSMQRLTAILLIPLSYWLLTFLQLCLHANYFEMTEWLATPVNQIGLSMWLLVVCYHAAIGLQVVLEDYVSHRGKQFAAIWTVHSLFAGLALSSIVLLLQG